MRASILLIDDDALRAERLVRHLQVSHYNVTVCHEPEEAISMLSRFGSSWNVILWNVSRAQWNCLNILRTINDLYRESRNPRPRILCFSYIYRGPQFRLDLERLGARLIYEQ